MATVELRTPDEISDLKWKWAADPCWDIEDTGGFEAHKEELLAFRKECESEWEQEERRRLERLAENLGCPGNLELARYVDNMERRIQAITDRLYRIKV